MEAATMPRPAAPDRSLTQRLDALERANKIRSARKLLKIELKAKRITPGDVLADVKPEYETMKIADFLDALPKVGRVKRNRILNACRISPSKTLSGLSERQRGELDERLRR